MELVTQRLVLRELRESDLDATAALYSDATFRHYEGELQSKEEIAPAFKAYLDRISQEPRERYILAVTIPPDDQLCGYIDLMERKRSSREWAIGWGINPGLWGRGYASEAALAVLRFAFEELKAHRVMASCHADNLASARVMEKLGMTREARRREVRWLNEQWWDEFEYAILERDVRE
jgi:RimJ/RimL family protein N-acetyltransferase